MNRTNCSNDPYNINHLNMLETENEIAEVFTQIINASFQTGIFPPTANQSK